MNTMICKYLRSKFASKRTCLFRQAPFFRETDHKQVTCFATVKREKVKRTVLSFGELDGGLKMVNIDKYIESIKVGWIKRLINGDLKNWKIIPLFYFNKFGKDFLIFHMNIDNTDSIPELKELPKFYFNIVKAWITNKKVQQPKNFRSIRQEVIWGNHFIKILK